MLSDILIRENGAIEDERLILKDKNGDDNSEDQVDHLFIG